MSNEAENTAGSQGENKETKIALLGKCNICGFFPAIWAWFFGGYLCKEHYGEEAKKYIKNDK